MAITISGTAGCQFDITTVDTATSTGSKTVEYKTETGIRSVTYTDASLPAALAGQVGTVGTDLDLYSISDVNDGTYYMRLQDNSSAISLSELLTIVIHNKEASGTITVAPGSSNSLLTASEQITLDAGQAVQLTWPSTAPKTVDATHRTIKLTGSTTNMDCEVYILGN
uniref:Uncharacterized protein n=1 Tax=viral metagenome TaxID=1070528 RepID=A0A6M3LWF5_9ZZZZ